MRRPVVSRVGVAVAGEGVAVAAEGAKKAEKRRISKGDADMAVVLV